MGTDANEHSSESLVNDALIRGLPVHVSVASPTGFVPTPSRRAFRRLKLSGLREGETIYELGSGSGGVLLIAAGTLVSRGCGVRYKRIWCRRR